MGLLIDMIDVGQGDSFLLSIDGPFGEAHVLIDAGLREAGAKVLSYIQKYAVSGLDMIIATHIDNDHVGGLATILAHARLSEGAKFVLNVPPKSRIVGRRSGTPWKNTEALSAFGASLRLSIRSRPLARWPTSEA